jgi:hypothetical protein
MQLTGKTDGFLVSVDEFLPIAAVAVEINKAGKKIASVKVDDLTILRSAVEDIENPPVLHKHPAVSHRHSVCDDDAIRIKLSHSATSFPVRKDSSMA